MYPSDDSLQATAVDRTDMDGGEVYPSDDSLQATAHGLVSRQALLGRMGQPTAIRQAVACSGGEDSAISRHYNLPPFSHLNPAFLR